MAAKFREYNETAALMPRASLREGKGKFISYFLSAASKKSNKSRSQKVKHKGHSGRYCRGKVPFILRNVL